MNRLIAAARIAFFVLGSSLAAAPLRAATFVVDSIGDGTAVGSTSDGTCDAQPGGAVVCTLRAAIEEANGLAGADDIHFAIGSGLAIISPGSAFPTITTRVTIGTTQPGYAGTPIIELNGASAGGGHALTLSGAGCSLSIIRGLMIDGFGSIATRIVTGSANNVIAGNYLGTDPAGTLTGRGNAVGIYITAGNNQIGGTTAADRNVISGNTSTVSNRRRRRDRKSRAGQLKNRKFEPRQCREATLGRDLRGGLGRARWSRKTRQSGGNQGNWER